MRTVVPMVILGVTLASCAAATPGADPSTTHAVAPQGSAPTPASPTPPAPIRVGALPAEGVAVDLGHEVVLLDMGGRTLHELPGYSLAFQWTVPGEVILRRGGGFFVLRVERGALQPLPSEEAAFDLDPQFQSHVGLPRPVGSVPGGGRWAYALPGPNDLVLAQWSGECEVPNAMFVSPGRAPLAVTGERSLRAPQSWALGWDEGGRAIVDLREEECGTSFEQPGIYAFTGPGVGQLVYHDHRMDGARMWGATA